MRNKLNKLIEQLEDMYLTENPVNLSDDDYGYKYFLCYHNTHSIKIRTKSLKAMIEEVEDIISR